MMKQYKEIKSNYKDFIVFFRLGDFYEMFYDDAKICSKELEITLTSRDKKNKVPMAGVPYHSADQYISKLISKGYKVVICEQVEDPKKAKDIVKREVVKVVTPGTITDLKALDESKNNFLGCIFKDKDNFGISFVDLMTGEFFTTEIASEYPYYELINELAKFQPQECIVNPDIAKDKMLKKTLKDVLYTYITVKDNEFFDTKLSNLDKQFKSKLFESILNKKFALKASKSCLKYLSETQKLSLHHIDNIKYYKVQDYMMLDFSCRRNLELTQSLKGNKKTGTLLWVLDNTSTAMGARLLRKWVEQPLIDIIRLKQRQDAVEELFNNFFLREELKESLKDVYDIERLTGKLVCGNANARDLISIKNTIKNFPGIKQSLSKCQSKLLKKLQNMLDPLEDVCSLIEKSIKENPPMTIRDSDLIKDGYDPDIDKLRQASVKGKLWLAELEKKEKERTKIKSLKVGFNKVFGYYIEVTKSNLNLVPENYIRKQTLVNSERYITEELKEYESLILNAEGKLQDLEYEVFCRIRNKVIKHTPRIQQSAYCISVLDCLLSLAEVSYKNNYIKPELTLDDEIIIKAGRHPVVEITQSDELFIPNDTHINCGDSMISIITGPNMAGKSTYMRQVALIVLMGQIGCFIPAEHAQIGIVDKIFARIGASDNLALGQSTFMVEMSEMAYILKNATKKSLLVLDEVGRGTSTFDGLSIAWAVIEYIQEKICAKTLFATHYHELTALKDLESIKTYKITVKEKGEDITFLRKIIPGEADKSYGIHVARLAGLPRPIIKRANQVLTKIERKQTSASLDKAINTESTVSETSPVEQLNLDNIKEQNAIEKLKKLDIDTLTPLEALNFLFSIKRELM